MKKLLFATMILAVVGCSDTNKEKKNNDVDPTQKQAMEVKQEESDTAAEPVVEKPKELKKRPVYDDSVDYGEPIIIEIKDRNIVEVNVSRSGNIMVDNQIYKRSDLVPNHTGHSRLSHEIFRFLVDDDCSEKRSVEIEPGKSFDLSEGIVSLKVDPEVTDELYSEVYYEIEHAFDYYREYVAMRLYGESYWDLPGKVQKYLRKRVPAKIYDADYPYSKLVIVADDKEIKQPELTFTEEASDFDDFEFDMDVVEEEIKQPELTFTEYASEFDDFEFDMGEVEEEIVEDEEIFTILDLEDPATFKGGSLGDFRNWVMERVRYPQIAQENGIQGNVIVEFVIDETGQLGRIKVLQSPDPVLSDAVIAVLQKSPKWKPGTQRGKAVKMKCVVPVMFKLTT